VVPAGKRNFIFSVVLLAAIHCQAQEGGRVFAILIGISKYRDQGVEWLKYADKDARSFADHLRTGRGGNLENIELFIDQDATRTKINQTFEKVLQRLAGARDTVYIFISARGFASADSEEGFISTFDSPDEKQLQFMLRVSELRKHLDATKAGKVVLFADVCRESKLPAFENENRINLKLEKLQQLRKPIEGVLATQARKVSKEIDGLEGGHGVFSFFLVNGLQARATFQGNSADSNGDGRVTFSEILDYLRRQMKANYQQDPMDFGEKSGRGFPLSDLSKKGMAAARPHFRGTVLLAWNGRQWPTSAGLLFYAGQSFTDRLYDQFTHELKAGNLLGPGGALELVGRLKAQMSQGAWEDERDRLATELEDRGEQIIALYGVGDRFPDDPLWSRLQLKPGDFERGEKRFDTANQLHPKPSLDARRLFCQGRALMFDPAKREAAKPILESAIRIDPAIPEAQNALGVIHLEESDLPEAIRYFREAHGQARRWAYPRINLALAYTEQGDYTARNKNIERRSHPRLITRICISILPCCSKSSGEGRRRTGSIEMRFWFSSGKSRSCGAAQRCG
jgi:tetratricopeptide (TPR) repeat protein